MAGVDKSVNFIFLGNNSDYSNTVLKLICRENLVPGSVAVPYFSYDHSKASSRQLQLENTYNKVESICQKNEIPLVYAPKPDKAALKRYLKMESYDFLVIACWPYLIDQEVRALVKKASINLHPSLLPEFSGINPIGSQIDERVINTGVTLHELDHIYDHGTVIDKISFTVQDLYSDENSIRKKFDKRAGNHATELLLKFFNS